MGALPALQDCMRTILLVISAFSLLTACATGRSDGSGQIQTTREANQENVRGAVSAPLRDVNVVRTKIPPILLEAMADPYARPPDPGGCKELTDMLTPVEEALGPDLDAPAPDEDDLMQRGQTTALGAAATVAADAIPFRGWIRKLSGAERHDQLVQSAIIAGAVRRAYLKGLGEAQGCEPPATPSHIHAGRAMPKDESVLREDSWTKKKPAYPIR
jgi:hypothetical protein